MIAVLVLAEFDLYDMVWFCNSRGVVEEDIIYAEDYYRKHKVDKRLS